MKGTIKVNVQHSVYWKGTRQGTHVGFWLLKGPLKANLFLCRWFESEETSGMSWKWELLPGCLNLTLKVILDKKGGFVLFVKCHQIEKCPFCKAYAFGGVGGQSSSEQKQTSKIEERKRLWLKNRQVCKSEASPALRRWRKEGTYQSRTETKQECQNDKGKTISTWPAATMLTCNEKGTDIWEAETQKFMDSKKKKAALMFYKSNFLMMYSNLTVDFSFSFYHKFGVFTPNWPTLLCDISIL